MGTDVINTTDALVAVYDEMTVLLGPVSGDAPSDTDVFDDVYCTRVVQSASGSRLDYAELTYVLRDHLKDRTQPEDFARMVDVKLPDADKTLIHRGDYVRESASVQSGGESLTAQSQMRSYHFGSPLTGYDVYPLRADSVTFSNKIHSDAVFNPMIDGRTLFNRSDHQVRPGGVGFTGYLWIHPESQMATIAQEYAFDDVPTEWTLDDAVTTMCWLLNPDEEFVRNYKLLDVVGDCDILNAPSLRAVTIPLGTRLPQALDLLLIPLGFNWYLNYQDDVDGDIKPRIRVFQIGVGPEKELKFQLPGSILDMADSNVNEFSADNNIGDSFNQVTVFGEYEESECTFPLFAAWAATHDLISNADLDKDGAQYVGHETVWRLFIANEAGDIDPAVTRLGQTPTVPDLTAIFELWVPHRRTLQEPLAYIEGTPTAAVESPQRRTHVLEYSIDSGSTWLASAEGWTVKLCPDQIGVLFDMKAIPEELYTAGSAGRLRITGSVFGDSRLNYTATRNAWAVNGRTNENVIVKPEKFQYRFRNIAGVYQSVLTGDADTKDDTIEIQEFAEAIRDQNQYAEIDCEFRLPGWHLEYEIGDLITKIAGREINLNAAPATAPVSRYVQVIERRFEMTPQGGPSTVLIVDRGIDENPAQGLNLIGTKPTSRVMAPGYTGPTVGGHVP